MDEVFKDFLCSINRNYKLSPEAIEYISLLLVALIHKLGDDIRQRYNKHTNKQLIEFNVSLKGKYDESVDNCISRDGIKALIPVCNTLSLEYIISPSLSPKLFSAQDDAPSRVNIADLKTALLNVVYVHDKSLCEDAIEDGLFCLTYPQFFYMRLDYFYYFLGFTMQKDADLFLGAAMETVAIMLIELTIRYKKETDHESRTIYASDIVNSFKDWKELEDLFGHELQALQCPNNVVVNTLLKKLLP